MTDFNLDEELKNTRQYKEAYQQSVNGTSTAKAKGSKANRSESVHKEKTPRPSQADLLVRLADSLILFHDDLGDPYAQISVSGHQEIWRCRSKALRRFLRYRFFQKYQKAPSSEALHAALGV